MLESCFSIVQYCHALLCKRGLRQRDCVETDAMSASSKFDLSSGSPDKSIFTSGQRGSYAAGSLDRSGSFRESIENPTLPAIPNLTRGSASSSQDVTSFFQCLRFDPKSMVTDHKLNRVDFKRLASVSLGIPLDDSPCVTSKGKPLSSPSPEECKRFKAAVRESHNKSRERLKALNESLSLMHKWFPTIPSRKRSRSDSLSSDRSGALYPADRAVISKMGPQNHASTNGFEVEPKSEERMKSSVPNKRTRTSMTDSRPDARATTPARSTGAVDRDREVLKVPNNVAVQGEERTLSISDGWEKSKMKKKRSGIKPDSSSSTSAAKPIGGSRDSKQGMQPRLLPEARSRLTDTHGLRPGVVNVGVGKLDGVSQQISSGMRTLVPRPEQDCGPKRDRSVEKERGNLKAINKTSGREDFSSGSPTSSTKLNANTRAPRSGSNVGPKLAPVVSRANSGNDWEISQCTNKIPATGGVNSRKRTPSMRSSSPPVAQWASQRPQKISRTARRTNLVPIVQSNDEPSTLDVASVIGNERRFSGNSPQQVKLKGDHFSASGLSESEESGAAEMKVKDKTKKTDDMDENSGQNVQKISNLMLPPRKNKVMSGEDHGDGVRRQGRTGRGFTSTRALMAEKLGNVGTAKQLRSAKLGFDKSESKAGRPPTRKLSDRKSYTRQKHTIVNTAADFLDDGHKELLAAAKAVTNPAQALSSAFWKQMESFFRFMSDKDVAFLKQQIDAKPFLASPIQDSSGMDGVNILGKGFCSNEIRSGGTTTSNVEHAEEHIALGMQTFNLVPPLYQRLISALISEGDEEFPCSGNQDLRFDVYESGFEQDVSVKSDSIHSGFLQSYDLSGCPTANGFKINASGKSFNELGYIPHDNGPSIPDAVIPGYDNSQNGCIPEHAVLPGNCTEVQYNNMSIEERLLLEIHCIGIFPELVPDSAHSGGGEISAELNKLDDMYHEQVSKKKSFLSRLLVSATETRELQDKEFEQQALCKLVMMAYEKYMACWGPNVHGMKSASGKMAKQAALAFVRRTLERCQEFQETGKSCFDEPMFRDIFISGCSWLADGKTVESIGEGECGNPEVRPTASLGAQQSPSLTNPEVYSADNLLPPNLSLEQICGKEESWSNRTKQKELLLDDVGGGAIGASFSNMPGAGSPFLSSTKGKRSERDREGKGSSREAVSRSGTKIGRPTTNNKGERKTKTKPKQKTTQLSASVNGLGKMSEKPKGTLPSTQGASNAGSSGADRDKIDSGLDDLEEPLDFSGLQIPEMDDLGVPGDFGGQGQDIGSWLNIDDDGLQDDDFMGLEIPMDDLTDLNMMV